MLTDEWPVICARQAVMRPISRRAPGTVFGEADARPRSEDEYDWSFAGASRARLDRPPV